MFLHLFVSHSVHRRGGESQHALGQTSAGQTPPTGRHPWQTPAWADTPLGRHTPPSGQTPPTSFEDTPLPGQTPPPDGHCCGRYASYFIAFLF